MQPDISVIITAYNVASYIERAIKSALTQEDVNIEVVVVDDASTDDTWARINAVNDPRVRPLRLKRNAGPGMARNAGMDFAKAPWLAMLDGDDAFLPGRLARLKEKAVRENADIIVDNMVALRQADGVQFYMFAARRLVSPMTLAGFIKGNLSFFGGGSYSLGYLKPVFSRAFLRKHGLQYDPELLIGEDYILLAEALACGAVCSVEMEPGYLYTVRAGSVSHRLAAGDVERMQAADARLLSRRDFDGEAMAAQEKREYAMHEALAFIRLVEAIKNNNGEEMLSAIRACPTAPRHLWKPLWARLRRLGKRQAEPAPQESAA